MLTNNDALASLSSIILEKLDENKLDNFVQLFFLEEKNLDFLNFVGKERFNKNAVKKICIMA